MTTFLEIKNVFYRTDAICNAGCGKFGADVPAGLVYHAGLYLTPNEKAKMIADDSLCPHIPEDSLGLGLLNG